VTIEAFLFGFLMQDYTREKIIWIEMENNREVFG